MTEDDDKEVIAQACVVVADIVKDFGCMAVEPYITQLVEATIVLLYEQSACQLVELDSEADDDDIKHDKILMDVVSDLLLAFAKLQCFISQPLQLKKASCPPQDRTMVVVTLTEVAQRIDSDVPGT